MWGLYKLWVLPTLELAFGIGYSKVLYHFLMRLSGARILWGSYIQILLFELLPSRPISSPDIGFRCRYTRSSFAHLQMSFVWEASPVEIVFYCDDLLKRENILVNRCFSCKQQLSFGSLVASFFYHGSSIRASL